VHRTYLFREFPTLQRVNDFIEKEMPENTRIISYGCSDGSELVSLLLDRQLRGLRKPVRYEGVDIVESVIQTARKGRYRLDPDGDPKESASFEQVFSQHDPHQYLTKEGENTWQLKPEYLSQLSYRQGSIQTVTRQELGEQPVVLLFRNAWYHLNQHYFVARDLYQAMPPGSLLVIGSVDVGSDFDRPKPRESLLDAGFELANLCPESPGENVKIYRRTRDWVT
jgi:chemotaxis methyl-accepting protein methylase